LLLISCQHAAIETSQDFRRFHSYLCAALSAGLFAFSPGVWLYAIQAEVSSNGMIG
jgi:hypothetical protein